MEYNSELGRIVISKSGRDIDRMFVIVGIINEKYVYISDGDLRKIEKPKKKKIKHLSITDNICDEIKKSVLSGEIVSNYRIRSVLKSYDTNKEV